MFENIYNSCLSNNYRNIYGNNKRNNTSIINSILINETIISPGGEVPFDVNRVQVSDDIVHDLKNNNTNFKICTSGLYKAAFTTNAKLYIGEIYETISLAIVINGNIIPGTIIKKSCGPNETVNLSTQVVFLVANGTTAILSIVALRENTPIIVCNNANIIIEKIY